MSETVLDERVRKILETLRDRQASLYDSEYADCCICDGQLEHTSDCIVTLAIELLTEGTMSEVPPDCECGHPYHTQACPVIVPGYEFNEPCGCVEYEAEQ